MEIRQSVGNTPSISRAGGSACTTSCSQIRQAHFDRTVTVTRSYHLTTGRQHLIRPQAGLQNSPTCRSREADRREAECGRRQSD